jgi:hypothetical protein
MSPPVQQRRVKWSDFNERTAVPNATAPAVLLSFFEVVFAQRPRRRMVDQEAQFAASTQVTQGALGFSLQTDRMTYGIRQGRRCAAVVSIALSILNAQEFLLAATF